MANDRMFQVIVVGGIGLASAAAMSVAVTACGGDTFPSEGARPYYNDASSDGFPAELGAPAPDGGGSRDAAAEADAFPQEGPVMVDAGIDARDAAAEADAFPQEGPIMLDGGAG